MKSKLSILTATALAVGFSALLGCREQPKSTTTTPSSAEVKTNLPPGFIIVCDRNAGIFAPMNGDMVYSGRNHTNRQSAVDHAWNLYDRAKANISPQRNWQECED